MKVKLLTFIVSASLSFYSLAGSGDHPTANSNAYSKIKSGVSDFTITSTDSQLDGAKRNQSGISEVEGTTSLETNRVNSSRNQIAANKKEIDNLKWRVTTAEQNNVKHVRFVVTRSYAKWSEQPTMCGRGCEDHWESKLSTQWRTDTYQWNVPASTSMSLPSSKKGRECWETGSWREGRETVCKDVTLSTSGSASISQKVFKFYGKNVAGGVVRLDQIQVYKNNRWQTLASPRSTSNRTYSL